MSRTYYLRRGNEVYGPHSAQQIREMAGDGTLGKTDYVGAADQDKWHVAGSVRSLFPNILESSHATQAQNPVPAKESAQPIASANDPVIDIGGFERDRERRRAARRKRTVPFAIAGGLIMVLVGLAAVSRRSPGDHRADTKQLWSDGTPTGNAVQRGADHHAPLNSAENSAIPPPDLDFTVSQWRNVLSTCHPDPDYILTDDDVYKAMSIYQFWKQVPTFAANPKRMFNIVTGCYYWQRDIPVEEWKYMFAQKWDPYWDEPSNCVIAERSRKQEIERRSKNAIYVRKSTKIPPYTGAFTRQEVSDVCKNSTAKIDIEFEITVAVYYRKGRRGNLRSAAEVKEMMCEETCDFVPGNPDRCCECESAIVDFVFHQQGWE